MPRNASAAVALCVGMEIEEGPSADTEGGTSRWGGNQQSLHLHRLLIVPKCSRRALIC